MPVTSFLSHISEFPPIAFIGRWILRGIRYVKARWRRFRTPKELRDADFDVWQSNMGKCASCFWLEATDPVRPSCEICGCLVELKTRWMSEKCPVGEWDNTIALRTRIATLGKHPADSPTQSNQGDH